MAVEDAAVLGNLLSRLSSLRQLPHFLHTYERLRYARASDTQESSRLNKYIFHLPDGPEQEARDNSMRRAMLVESARQVLQDVSHVGSGTGKGEIRVGGGLNEQNANQWADRKKNEEQFGYDADAEVEQWWSKESETMLESLNGSSSPDTSTLASDSSHRSEKKSFWRRLVGGRRDNAIPT